MEAVLRDNRHTLHVGCVIPVRRAVLLLKIAPLTPAAFSDIIAHSELGSVEEWGGGWVVSVCRIPT